MQTVMRQVPKNLEIEQYDGISVEMKERMLEYRLSLHGIKESTKDDYLSKIEMLGRFSTKRGITRFEDVSRKEIDLFLSRYKNENTLNLYIHVFKSFYKFINRPEAVNHLKLYTIKLEPITPSEIFSPQEVIELANEAGRRRDLYKTLILTLFESCARISEVLGLKVGDVVFSSVRDKEKQRKLIATLYFKRSKGNVSKQPVTLIMFAGELKRYTNNRDSQSWLFPSPYDKEEHIRIDAVEVALWNAGQRLGVKKRLNPHWLRHSGLSFFANNKNYNEQLLMWRAGWKNTSMAKRYIHSGAELEKQAYLQRMGYAIEPEKEDVKITPKTCGHCQGLNPTTNKNCDFCGMPLDPEAYQKEIEKRRRVQDLYENLDNISAKKINKKQKAELGRHIEVMMALVERGRNDLAEQYIEKLLGNWTKTFLTD